MRQGVIQRDALGRVEREHFVQEILELAYFAHLLFREVLVGDKLLLEIADGLDDAHDDDFVLREGWGS
jgi:hypothetical protein